MTFYFPYVGSKRLDLKFFKDYIFLDGCDKIVEPFCGSSAFSYHCFINGFKKKFHLNDLDTELYNFLIKLKIVGGIEYFVNGVNCYGFPKDREEYKDNCDDGEFGFFYRSRIYGIRKGMPPQRDRNVTVDIGKIKNFDNFYLRPELTVTNNDFNVILDKYVDDPKAFIFLDPPYFDSFNAQYIMYGKESHGTDKIMIDNTKMFIDIFNFISKAKCRVLMILNKNAITEHIFKKYIVGEYDKMYQITKKKTVHLIITKN